jgi:NAD(P)H-flavin reductase
MMKHENPYLPYPVRITDIITETEDRTLKTFKLVFLNEEDEARFAYTPGQFAEISVPGQGEIPIGIASSPTEKGFLTFTVQKMGKVTTYLHNMKVGDVIGLRGPLGNYYPWKEMEGQNISIIGGGCAFSTLRSSIVYMLDPANRSKFGDINVVYGARNTGLLLYRDEIMAWTERDDINMNITVDAFGPKEEAPGWRCHVGFVPAIVEKTIPAGDTGLVVVCGPPAMIRFTKPVLQKIGFSDDRIILSLENRMKCGVGMCGRCNVGEKFVCKDGPVFTLAELNGMPDDV